MHILYTQAQNTKHDNVDVFRVLRLEADANNKFRQRFYFLSENAS